MLPWCSIPVRAGTVSARRGKQSPPATPRNNARLSASTITRIAQSTIDVPVIDAQATATAVLVYQLILLLARMITPEEASWLYLGIVTDTASFRFPNTNAEAHRTVADLADHGADERQLYAADV